MTFWELIEKWEEPTAEGAGARIVCASELKDLVCYWIADITKQTTQGSIPRQFILNSVLGAKR